MRLAGKVTVVTGANSGIGLATARRFAAEGAAVVLADIEDASERAAEIRGRCASYMTGSIVAVDGGWTAQ